MLKTIIVVSYFMILWTTGCSTIIRPNRYLSESGAGFMLSDAITTAANKEALANQFENIVMFDKPCSVSLVNRLDLEDKQVVRKAGAMTFYADYREWTTFFIDAWSTQLRRLGCQVSDQSANNVGVRLFGFRYDPHFWYTTSNIAVELDAFPRDYKEIYYGYANRVGIDFSTAVYQTIAKLLQDSGVRAQLELR